jgi:segregation and condensation protein A
MVTPTYILPEVIKDKGEHPGDFEGPLDLILSMLARDKIAIRDIRISLILEQYFEYLSNMERMDIEVTSEFVAMAAHLVYLKTQEMLQEETGEELSELEQFMRALEERQSAERFGALKTVFPALAERYERASGSYTRYPEPLEKGKREYKHDKNDLIAAMRGLSEASGIRKRAESKIADVVPRPEISVETKISQIMRALSGARETTLKDLFRLSRNRSEIVATFLAVLELCRRSSVRVFGRRSDYRIVLGDKDRSGADE